MHKIYCKTQNQKGDVSLRTFESDNVDDCLYFVKDYSAAKKEIQMLTKEKVVSAILTCVK